MKRHKKLAFKTFKYYQSWDHKLSGPRWKIRWLIRSSMPMHIPTIHRGSDLWDKSTLASRPPLWQNKTIISVRMKNFVDLVPITTISGLDQEYLWLIHHVFIVSFLHRLIYTRVRQLPCSSRILQCNVNSFGWTSQSCCKGEILRLWRQGGYSAGNEETWCSLVLRSQGFADAIRWKGDLASL